eukprot:4981155-Heterocapsa_arctica.AAC.1
MLQAAVCTSIALARRLDRALVGLPHTVVAVFHGTAPSIFSRAAYILPLHLIHHDAQSSRRPS